MSHKEHVLQKYVIMGEIFVGLSPLWPAGYAFGYALTYVADI